MQTFFASMLFAIVIGIPNALVLVMLINAWGLRRAGPQLTAEERAKREKHFVDGAKIARNCMIFVIGAAAFYFGLSLGEGHLDPAVIQLSLEGLGGALLPLVAWRWFTKMGKRYRAEI